MALPGEKPYPVAAQILSMIGGIFILFDGIWLIVYAAYLPGQVNGTPYLPVSFVILGIIGMIIGIVVMYIAIQLRQKPEDARKMGPALILLSIFSIFTGAGFIGLFFPFMGGILAMTWVSPEEAQKIAAQQAAAAPAAGAAAAPGAAPPGKVCPKCGVTNPAGNAFCAKCGAQLPG